MALNSVCFLQFLLLVTGAFCIEVKLLAGDGEVADEFGYSVSIDGDIAIVGAHLDNDNGLRSGSVYVFERNRGGANNWGFEKKILASDGQSDDRFGSSVSVSGHTAVVGAFGKLDSTGAVYVFNRDQGGTANWGEATKLAASDGVANDLFGISVASNSNTIVVGSLRDDDQGSASGSAYVFSKNESGAWFENKKLLPSDGGLGDNFGRSVGLSGEYAVVGSPENNGRSGASYIFSQHFGGENNWGEVAKLSAFDGASNDEFGYSVALAGDLAVAGAYRHSGERGSVYVFSRNKGGTENWGLLQKLNASDGSAGSIFGWRVSARADVVAVSAPLSANPSGSIYIYRRNEGGIDNFGEVAKLFATDMSLEDQLGYSVAATTAFVVAGGPLANSNVGLGYVFELDFAANETALFPTQTPSLLPTFNPSSSLPTDSPTFVPTSSMPTSDPTLTGSRAPSIAAKPTTNDDRSFDILLTVVSVLAGTALSAAVSCVGFLCWNKYGVQPPKNVDSIPG